MPIITPIIIAKEKPFNIGPPKMNIDNSANKVVADVINVLDNVSFVEMFEISDIKISDEKSETI